MIDFTLYYTMKGNSPTPTSLYHTRDTWTLHIIIRKLSTALCPCQFCNEDRTPPHTKKGDAYSPVSAEKYRWVLSGRYQILPF